MTDTEALAFLAGQSEGRLATCGASGEPYITPLNFLYRDGNIYFHSKLDGRKLENIAENSRVCFEVSSVDKLMVSVDRACGCSTRYSSVLAFGDAQILNDTAEKAALLNLLVKRYADGKPCQPVKEEDAAGCAVVEIRIRKLSGKRNVDPQ
jgi:nitroimidazol reductase NimA-like FMN-containing flavoprotein (pyridoxamine 5'-phosphate oxidase superfamily)